MSVATYTKTGTKATTPAKLDKDIFGLTVENHELIKQAYVAYLANGRENYAVTKTRGLVSGGGKKPWKQKGTGRARFGSSRVPIWRGGGITFGPTGEENYSHKMHVKAKRLAIRQSLSLAAKEDRVKVIAAFDTMDGKTKAFVALLTKLEATRNVLVVVDAKDAAKERAAQNIPYVKVVGAQNLNVYDVTNANTIIVTTKALDVISAWLGTTKKAVEK
jgi:large subunit ribosomal protein L4